MERCTCRSRAGWRPLRACHEGCESGHFLSVWRRRHAATTGCGAIGSNLMALGEQMLDPAWQMALTLPGRLRHDSLLRNSVYNMATTVANSLLGYLYWIVA